MKKILIVFLIIFSIFILILAGGYLYIRYMPDKNLREQVADFKMPASALSAEYETNQSVSDKKFIDRIIEVTGVISEISTDQNNDLVFILRDGVSSTGVLCTLNGKATKNASRYRTGDKITIKGTCSGMLFEVVLNKCIIINR